MTALDVDIFAAEQNVNRLADAIQKTVRSRINGTDAIELFLDEEWTFVAHSAREIALALFFGATRDLCATLAETKVGGAELLGHR